MKEFINNLFHTSTERIKNPFIGSFIIAAIIFNWRAIFIILLSNEDIEKRINFIEQNYLSWETTLVYPLLIGIFYVLILPYIMVFFDFLVKSANENQIRNHYDKEIIRVRKKSQVAQLVLELERIRADSSDISHLREQIENLTKTTKEKDNIIVELQNKYDDLMIKTNNATTNILKQNSLKFENGISDEEFKGILNDSNKYEVLMALGKGSDININGIRYDFYEQNKEILKYFNSIGIIDLGKNKTDSIEAKLTNKGRVYYRRLLENVNNPN